MPVYGQPLLPYLRAVQASDAGQGHPVHLQCTLLARLQSHRVRLLDREAELQSIESQEDDWPNPGQPRGNGDESSEECQEKGRNSLY